MTSTQTAAEARPTTQPTDPTIRVTDPHRLHEAFMAVTNAHDVEGMVSLYATEGMAVQLDGSQVQGEAELRSMVTGLVSAIRHIEGGTRKVFVVGDVALSSGHWTADVVLPDGSTIVQQGVTAEVSVRQPDGTWKFLIDDPMFA